MKLAVKAFAIITLYLFLLGGCASQDTWSKSDRGAPEPPSLFDYYFRPGVVEEYRSNRRIYEAGVIAEALQRANPLQGNPSSETSGSEQDGLLGRGLLGPSTPNAFGPGINSDATGRPFVWRPDFGGPALGPIQPDAYGPGVGMDATGRPVRPACPPGWVGSC